MSRLTNAVVNTTRKFALATLKPGSKSTTFIHRIHSKISLHIYGLSFGPENPPHPLSVAPPPPQCCVECIMVISPADRISCLPGRLGGGWSSDTQEGQTGSLESLVTLAIERSVLLRIFCLNNCSLIITIFILYQSHLHQLWGSHHLYVNPGVKVSCFAFSQFVRILQEFPQMRKALLQSRYYSLSRCTHQGTKWAKQVLYCTALHHECTGHGRINTVSPSHQPTWTDIITAIIEDDKTILLGKVTEL